jgi:hypothetical protein
MDDLQSNNSSGDELADEALNATPHASERDVLEGEVFQPRMRREEPSQRRDPGISENVEAEGGEKAGAQESVETGLAQYVFVREEREREVRLLFRDASPADVARTFRSAGAHLITLSAERATPPSTPIVTPHPTEQESDNEEGEDNEISDRASKRREGKPKSRKLGHRAGEVLLRYFYALGEIVYTVSIISPTGVAASISSIYPLASRSEHDLTERLAVVFV